MIGQLLCDGEWITNGTWDEVRSPYSGHVVGRVPRADAALTRSAVSAAFAAMGEPLPAWRRAEILERVAHLVGERRDELAHLIMSEAGKPIAQARTEVDRCRATYRAAAVEAQRLTGEALAMDAAPGGEGKVGFTIRVPVGVVAAITPFNFPLNLVAHKIAPALAAGCAVVLKPAPQAPLSALALAALEVEAGLPPGWLNVVCGPADAIGEVLLADERVELITFTGSARVGWMLRERAPRKRVTLELGNATPVIVEPDADLDAAAARIARSGFAFAGQACISVQRVLVHRAVHDPLVERLVPLVDALVVGDPADDATDIGPVIDRGARERLLGWIAEAQAEGASLVTGGRLAGELLRPTVLTGVRSQMRVWRDEAFGPVVGVAAYETFAEAIALANDTRYGLQAGIFTRDLARAFAATRALRFGGVTVNETPTFRLDHTPYGGVKESGNAKEGPAYAVRSMTEERLVVFDVTPDPESA